MPFIMQMVSAHAVIFITEPDMWIVAHRGTVNAATSLLTPLSSVCLSVTGIVAADDDVPSAVKYAGSIRQSSFSGLRRATAPATQNW